MKNLQLTFIPSKYWVSDISGFKIISKNTKTKIPNNSNFFLLWISDNNNMGFLENEIQKIFPKIPVKKLLGCSINLVIPGISAKKSTIEEFYPIVSNIGKIIPISPLISILFQVNININKNLDRRRYDTNYSDSIRIWAYLTKLTIELLLRGSFLPTLQSSSDNNLVSQWQVHLKNQFDHIRFKKIIKNTPWVCHNLPINSISKNNQITSKKQYCSGIWHPTYLFNKYITNISDLLIRSSIKKK